MDSGGRSRTGTARARWGLRKAERVFCVAFLGLAALVPLAAGDLYPFTPAPMFAERFERFCVYRVVAPAGAELDAAAFALQHNHGGNPLGYRGGFEPPPTLHPFGVIASEAEVRAHVRARLAARGERYVTVQQTIIGPLPNGSVGPTRTRTWRIDRPRAHD